MEMGNLVENKRTRLLKVSKKQLQYLHTSSKQTIRTNEKSLDHKYIDLTRDRMTLNLHDHAQAPDVAALVVRVKLLVHERVHHLRGHVLGAADRRRQFGRADGIQHARATSRRQIEIADLHRRHLHRVKSKTENR